MTASVPVNNRSTTVYNRGTTWGTRDRAIVDSSRKEGHGWNPSTTGCLPRTRFRTRLSTLPMPHSTGPAGDIHSPEASINNNNIFKLKKD